MILAMLEGKYRGDRRPVTKQYEVRDTDGNLVEFGDTLTYPPYEFITGKFSHVATWPGGVGGPRVVISGMEFFADVWQLSVVPFQPESD